MKRCWIIVAIVSPKDRWEKTFEEKDIERLANRIFDLLGNGWDAAWYDVFYKLVKSR